MACNLRQLIDNRVQEWLQDGRTKFVYHTTIFHARMGGRDYVQSVHAVWVHLRVHHLKDFHYRSSVHSFIQFIVSIVYNQYRNQCPKKMIKMASMWKWVSARCKCCGLRRLDRNSGELLKNWLMFKCVAWTSLKSGLLVLAYFCFVEWIRKYFMNCIFIILITMNMNVPCDEYIYI